MLLGFLDELEKVSAFNTMGLAPETVLEKSQPPPPMETAGFEKARNILERAAQTKTAASRQIQRALPGQPGIGKLTHQGDNSQPEQVKSVAGYGLAGLGAGAAVHKAYSSAPSIHAAMSHPDLSAAQRFASSARVNNIGHKMMLGGAAAGAGYGVYRAVKKSRMAKQAMSPDAKMLAAMGATGLAAGGLGFGAGLKKGRKETAEAISMAQSHGSDPKRWPLSKKAVIEKTATIASPALALKASKQVGKARVTPSASGPSINTQIRGQLIGKKGTP